MVKIRTYSELVRLETIEERYQYLKLGGTVGYSTFGMDRYVNQTFYMSTQWRQLRHEIIFRDKGCDLGVEGYDIYSGLYIHHMNPMNVAEIVAGDPAILDPEFLITVTHRTHNAIHYGDATQVRKGPVERKPGDTKLW